MNYILGLDIGIASVGWAVINDDKKRIEDLGIRLFKKAEESDGKSLNSDRREARGVRRRIRRRAVRMQKVKELFVEYNLVSDKELEDLYVMDSSKEDVWELRYKALNEKIGRKEFARVLTNIAKRRGYKSNRKTDEEDKENEEVGKLSKGTQENKRLLQEKGYLTIGEMFYKDEKFKNNKRNKGKEYSNTVLRSMLMDEVGILFEKQREYGNEYATKEFEDKYVEIVTHQRPYMTDKLLERMLGRCTFEKDEQRAPKNSYSFERFMLLQKINNLKIDINGTRYELSPTQRKEIVEMAYSQAEVKYSQLRKKLALPEEARFNALNYSVNSTKKKAKKKVKNETNEEPNESDIVKTAEDSQFVKLEGWHKIRLALKENKERFEMIKQNPIMQNTIADALVRNKTDDDIRNYLSNQNIDDEITNKILSIMFSGFGHLSYKALNNLIPKLEEGMTYDKACEACGYEFKGSKNELKKKLPTVDEIGEKIVNPVVLRAVSQTRKVINAVIDKYGSPKAIHIEMARDISKPYDEREKIEARQKNNFEKNEELKKEIKETFKFDPKPFDIVKMKLWKEQKHQCAYSQKEIPAERLFEENYVQVDHIIPFSRCFDDSYNNKVLVLTEENQRKAEKTPYEYFGENEERWHRFEEFVNSTYKFRPKKKENLLMKNFDEEKSKTWIERNINDTKYIARFMRNYIENNLQFAESELKRKVYTINGNATDVLRHYWGIKKNREESDKHHAQDAVVIACATSENIRKVSEYSKYDKLYRGRDENGKRMYNEYIKMKEPWPRFREELEARMEDGDLNGELHGLKYGGFTNYDDVDITKIKPIFASRVPIRKITGKAHKDTMRSLKFINKGYTFTTVKKHIQSIKESEISSIVNDKKFESLYMSDKKMYDDIYEKMKQNGFKAEKAFADGYRKHSKKGEGPIVRSIKVPAAGEAGVKLKNGSIADNKTMVRVDVFKKGKKFYLVPIYAADFVNKKLPNKAVAANKSESEWPEMTEEYEFQFSLYPNDLIKIKQKKGKEFFCYYNGFDRSNSSIKYLEVNCSLKKNKVGAKSLEIFEKYEVDVLGNVSKIKKEKRKGV